LHQNKITSIERVEGSFQKIIASLGQILLAIDPVFRWLVNFNPAAILLIVCSIDHKLAKIDKSQVIEVSISEANQ
jgi:hypothetical protein